MRLCSRRRGFTVDRVGEPLDPGRHGVSGTHDVSGADDRVYRTN
jgi:hypothetical protein